ncbi:MAG: hypothetical protein WC972_09850 [Trueperaceae bacterium]|nr:hypothetical protein [Trueperaceae bacterium]HRQ09564.1 hypothetical protein [Trueperaceae bacterium]
MQDTRKLVLLLVAALFGAAQASIAPYFDPGETGSRVVASHQSFAAGELERVAKAPSSALTQGATANAGAQWLDPGYEGAGGAIVTVLAGVPTAEQEWAALHAENRQIAMSQSTGPGTLVRAFQGPTASPNVAGSGQIGAQWLDPGFTYPAPIEAELVDDTSADDMACGGGAGLLAKTSLVGAQQNHMAGVRGKCQDVLA